MADGQRRCPFFWSPLQDVIQDGMPVGRKFKIATFVSLVPVCASMGARGSKTVQDSQSLAKQHDQTWIANDTTAFSAATRSGVISVTSKGKKNKDMVGGLRIKAPGKSRESGQQPVEEPLPRPRQKQVQIREQQKPPHEDDDEDESKYILSKERRQRKLTDFYWVPEKEVARGKFPISIFFFFFFFFFFSFSFRVCGYIDIVLP